MSDPFVVLEVNCSDDAIAPVVRDPTPAELAAVAAAAPQIAAAAAIGKNRDTLAAKATDAIAQLRAAADALDTNTLTAAQQRAALALCCRTTARLVRLVLSELDAAD